MGFWPMERVWKGYMCLPSLVHRNIPCWISATPNHLFTLLHLALSLRSLALGILLMSLLVSCWVGSLGGTCKRLEAERKEVREFVPLGP